MKKKTLLIVSYVNLHHNKIYPVFTEASLLIKHFSLIFDNVELLCQPMFGETTTKTFIYSDYINNKFSFSNKQQINKKNKTSILLKVRDFISTFLHLSKSNYDLILAVESINCLSALIAKLFFNKKMKVIYFCNDYHPDRYGAIMTTIYNLLDKFCAYKSDYNWLMNMDIIELRNNAGIKNSLVNNLHDISGGIAMADFSYKNRRINSTLKLIYAARNHDYGLKLAQDLAVKIAKKSNLDVILYVTGKLEPTVNKVKNLKIIYTDFLEIDELNKLIYNSDIGLAFYPDTTLSSSEYGDPEKIRRYINCGLPLIVTGKGKTIEMVSKQNVGIHTFYNLNAIFGALNLLLNDKKYYLKVSNNSFNLAITNRKSDKVFKSLKTIFNEL
ncbi:hypothetical protein OAM56_01875 [Alphaproteobacteria bacterium]|nr:hypothetical protein [Alphaproteobacteria bacterium]